MFLRAFGIILQSRKSSASGGHSLIYTLLGIFSFLVALCGCKSINFPDILWNLRCCRWHCADFQTKNQEEAAVEEESFLSQGSRLFFNYYAWLNFGQRGGWRGKGWPQSEPFRLSVYRPSLTATHDDGAFNWKIE